jgi:hypothetical protein
MTALLVALVLGAPAPKYREPPRPAIVAGVHQIRWAGGIVREVTFNKDGTYTWPWINVVHRGTWIYDGRTGNLYLNNTVDGQSFDSQAFKMCQKCRYGECRSVWHDSDGMEHNSVVTLEFVPRGSVPDPAREARANAP